MLQTDFIIAQNTFLKIAILSAMEKCNTFSFSEDLKKQTRKFDLTKTSKIATIALPPIQHEFKRVNISMNL
jgi:hypothetical protein